MYFCYVGTGVWGGASVTTTYTCAEVAHPSLPSS
jgi:hypothetical protein